MIRILIFSFILSALFGCDSSRIYEQFQETGIHWHQDSSIVFVADVPNEYVGPYNLVAHFVNDNSYDYYNLYFQYRLKNENDSLLKSELKELIIFHPKTGYPMGAGSGDKFENKIILEENADFSGVDSIRVEFQQFMRVQELQNIVRVGLRLEKITED